MSKRMMVVLGGVSIIAIGSLALFVVAPQLGLSGEDGPSTTPFSKSSPLAMSDGRSELERCISDWEDWRQDQSVEYEAAIFESSPNLNQGIGEVAVLRFSGGECGVTVGQDPSLDGFGLATLIDRGAGFESFVDTAYGRVPMASVFPQLETIGEIGQQFVNAYLGPGYALQPLDGSEIIPVEISGEIKGVEGLGDRVPKDRIAYAIDADAFSDMNDSEFISAVSQFGIDYRDECPKTAIAEIGMRYRDGELKPSTWSSPSLQITLRNICRETVKRMEAAEERLTAAFSALRKEWVGYSQEFKLKVIEKYLDEYGCTSGDIEGYYQSFGKRETLEEYAFYTTRYLRDSGYYSGSSLSDVEEAMDYWCDNPPG